MPHVSGYPFWLPHWGPALSHALRGRMRTRGIRAPESTAALEAAVQELSWVHGLPPYVARCACEGAEPTGADPRVSPIVSPNPHVGRVAERLGRYRPPGTFPRPGHDPSLDASTCANGR